MVGQDTENNFLAPAKRDVVGGLQFEFALPYKGYFHLSPLMYWEFYNHNAFDQRGVFGPGIPAVKHQQRVAGVSNHSCAESSLYSGITVKF